MRIIGRSKGSLHEILQRLEQSLSKAAKERLCDCPMDIDP